MLTLEKKEDAYWFPVVGSILLFSLFVVYKYLGSEWISVMAGGVTVGARSRPGCGSLPAQRRAPLHEAGAAAGGRIPDNLRGSGESHPWRRPQDPLVVWGVLPPHRLQWLAQVRIT